jgi:hypothetical protein
LPDHEPWRAWANFEFIDDEGRVNEVDLLVLPPAGLILVEIKSRPGTVQGDASTWKWITEGRPIEVDNPLPLADRKAQATRERSRPSGRLRTRSHSGALDRARDLPFGGAPATAARPGY